ncbi:MAG TPA: ATP-binding protein [Gemmatimonadales bacterium]|nr:ATP-binding protein [Gemmatimonadales bacterium]
MTQPSVSRGLALQWKLPLLVGALMALLTTAALIAAWAEVRQAAIRTARVRLETVSAQFAQQLESQAKSYLDGAEKLAADPVLAAALRDGDRFDTAAVAALLLEGDVVAAELLDERGALRWEGGRDLAAVRTLEAQRLRESSRGGSNRGIGVLQAIGDTLVFPIVAVVRDGERRVGYVARWFASRPNPRGPEAVATLIGLGARLYLGSPGGSWSDQARIVAPPPVPPESLERMRFYERDSLGRQLAVGATVSIAPWMIVTEFPVASITAPATGFLRRGMIGAGILLTLGVLVGVVVTRRVTLPLRELTDASDRLAAGDRAVRVPVRSGDEFGRLGAAFNAMAEQVDSEVAARTAAEAQWRLLFAENPMPMWVVDLETLGFLAVNQAAVEQYGWQPQEWATMTIKDIRPSEDLPGMQAVLDRHAQGGMRAALVRHQDRGGRVFEVELNGREVTFQGRHARLVMGLDLTERRALEQQLRQAQKMEAVGRLAGGVAHDFNNSLAVISAYAELTAADLRAAGLAQDNIEEVLRASTQAHALTRQLLTFSRQQVTRPEVLPPNPIAESVGRMASRLVEEDVRITFDLDPHVSAVRIDPGQLEQVLLNLVVNARDAMPHGGQLTIASTMRTVEEGMIAAHGLGAPGRYVVLSVSDTGTGITADVRARIFDPFFTTKPVGKGTGLGLATAYGIVAAAGGAITVYSEVGVGSTFRVYLPEVAGAPTRDLTAMPLPTPVRSTGHELVLLVEDDVAVRVATTAVLERLGYRVLAAETPVEALALAADPAQAIDIVLSDVVMPEMPGPALVARLRETRPTLKAILMSGYAGDAVASRGVEASQLPFLEKPFTIAALAATLRAELDRG